MFLPIQTNTVLTTCYLKTAGMVTFGVPRTVLTMLFLVGFCRRLTHPPTLISSLTDTERNTSQSLLKG